MHDVVAEVTRPLLDLADWRAVDLAPGESARVGFTVTAAMFGHHDAAMRWRVESGEVDVVIGPDAAHGARARLRVVGRAPTADTGPGTRPSSTTPFSGGCGI